MHIRTKKKYNDWKREKKAVESLRPYLGYNKNNELCLTINPNKRMYNFPKEITQIRKLKKINIINTRIGSIPKGISNLKELKELYIVDSNIHFIPKRIAHLENLEELVVTSSKITHIPKYIKYLKNLKSLIISKNKIEEIPEEIEQLNNLKRLNVAQNPISTLPIQTFKKCNSLEVINIKETDLSSGRRVDELQKECPNINIYHDARTKNYIH